MSAHYVKSDLRFTSHEAITSHVRKCLQWLLKELDTDAADAAI
jgi:hypothetical protein